MSTVCFTGIDGQTIDVSNTVDIRNEIDAELAMRIVTNIQNENGEFYTDLNGFQVRLMLSMLHPLNQC